MLIVKDCYRSSLTHGCMRIGELEVNEEEFADWDERCHGPMDTEENQLEYPENFTWTCCEGIGGSEGCEIARHEPELQQDRRKRARYY